VKKELDRIFQDSQDRHPVDEWSLSGLLTTQENPVNPEKSCKS
jgi:hypothetical protein